MELGSVLESELGSWTEMEIQCVKGTYMLKLVSSKKKLGF